MVEKTKAEHGDTSLRGEESPVSESSSVGDDQLDNPKVAWTSEEAEIKPSSPFWGRFGKAVIVLTLSLVVLTLVMWIAVKKEDVGSDDGGYVKLFLHFLQLTMFIVRSLGYLLIIPWALFHCFL